MLRTALLTVLLLALTAPAALASEGHDGGEGWLGETNDKIVTNAGFILIATIPTLILVASLVQWRLDRRKDRRLADARERRLRADNRGGW